MNDFNSKLSCHVEDVAAYLDGELDNAALTRFEDHLKSCRGCTDELRTQRQLLCTLDVAFNDSQTFALPQDFARIVTTRAESDVSGMRKHPERRRALKICAVLMLASLALMGAAVRGIVIDPARAFLRAVSALLDLCWQAASEVAATAAVVVRMIGRAAFFSQNGAALFLVLLLLLITLLFLIVRYHRAQIIE